MLTLPFIQKQFGIYYEETICDMRTQFQKKTQSLKHQLLNINISTNDLDKYQEDFVKMKESVLTVIRYSKIIN